MVQRVAMAQLGRLASLAMRMGAAVAAEAQAGTAGRGGSWRVDEEAMEANGGLVVQEDKPTPELQGHPEIPLPLSPTPQQGEVEGQEG